MRSLHIWESRKHLWESGHRLTGRVWVGEGCACCSLGLIPRRLPRGAAVTPVTPATLAVLISLQASLSLLDILSRSSWVFGNPAVLQAPDSCQSTVPGLTSNLRTLSLFLFQGGARGSENPARLPKAAQLAAEAELCEAGLRPAHFPGLTGWAPMHRSL